MILEHLRPTFQSVGRVLSNYLATQAGNMLIKRTREPLGDITGMCSVYGSGFHLSFALSFNQPTILSIASRFTQKAHHECDAAIFDIVSIITTAVAAEVKRRLHPMGYRAEITHPVLFFGYDNKIVHPIDEPCLILPVNTEQGIIFLEICIQRQLDCAQAG